MEDQQLVANKLAQTRNERRDSHRLKLPSDIVTGRTALPRPPEPATGMSH